MQQQQDSGSIKTDDRLAIEASYTSNGIFDEMYDGQLIRPHWLKFLKAINNFTPDDLNRIKVEASRFLRENGVIYNVQNELNPEQKTWELDPVPVLVNDTQWQELERGLQQRAKLFDLMMKDFYGEQNLFKDGIIPPECVIMHNGFLRPAVNTLYPNPISLPLFSFDFVRGADGKPWIVSDKTQTPAGSGHSLENRLLMSDLLSDEFRLVKTARIASYFRAMKAYLHALTPRVTEHPRIVVLTPGPSAKTYFEHAYLASYLGCHLVLGDDLTVQDGIVWLKSLEGLKRIDVIIRRVDDIHCDPVELSSNSGLGVPGLIDAVRQRNVVIVNPLGSGLMENPAFYPYLPAIANYFLGEELLLPSIATWWCGQEQARTYVFENIESLIIKSIDHHRPSIRGDELDEVTKKALINEINAAPYKFVGQDLIQYSTSPSLKKDALAPSKIQIRMFVAADTTNNYTVMPGGMAHVVDPNDQTSPLGGTSKDVWVMSDSNASYPDLDAKTTPVFNSQKIKELGTVLPSRAAETLFWVGRYVERAEAIARQLRLLINELNTTGAIEDWDSDLYLSMQQQSLQIIVGHNLDTSGASKAIEFSVKKAFNDIRSFLIGSQQNISLCNVLQDFIRSAFGVRDLWSSDTWRTIDEIDAQLRSLQESPIKRFSWQKRIDAVIAGLMAFVGLTNESMVHENSWRMLEIGRKIERLSTQSRLLNFYFSHKNDEVTESNLCEASLRLYETLIVHRRRYRNIPDIEGTLDLLLIDIENPRAIAHQIEKLKTHIDYLPRHTNKKGLSDAQVVCLRVSTSIQLIDLEQMNFSEDTARKSLSTLLTNLNNEMNTLSEILAHHYFSHTQPSQQLISIMKKRKRIMPDDSSVEADA